MRILPYGWDSVLLEVPDPAAWSRSLHAARDRGELCCAEIVPAARTVLVRGLLPGLPGDQLELSRWAPESAVQEEPREVTIPVRWDGPDLADVARRWGTDPAQRLRAITFTVAFCGFLPGFAYLTGLPAELHLPRLDTPRSRVPAGAVALAGPYAGIYPRSSPGGWRLVGSTRLALFDLAADPPALLTPGTTVRFADA